MFFLAGSIAPKIARHRGFGGSCYHQGSLRAVASAELEVSHLIFLWGGDVGPILKKAPWRHSPFKQQQIDDKHRIISTTNLVIASLTRHSPKSRTYIRVFSIPIFTNIILNNFPCHYSKGSTTEKRNEQLAASLTTLSQATRHLQVPVSQTACSQPVRQTVTQ